MFRSYFLALVIILFGFGASDKGVTLWIVVPVGVLVFVVFQFIFLIADATWKNTWGFGGPRKDKF